MPELEDAAEVVFDDPEIELLERLGMDPDRLARRCIVDRQRAAFGFFGMKKKKKQGGGGMPGLPGPLASLVPSAPAAGRPRVPPGDALEKVTRGMTNVIETAVSIRDKVTPVARQVPAASALPAAPVAPTAPAAPAKDDPPWMLIGGAAVTALAIGFLVAKGTR
jgi:hypothetical protein